MQLIIKPERKEWKKLLERPYLDNSSVVTTVSEIMDAVKKTGDAALRELTQKLDGNSLHTLAVSGSEIADAIDLVPEQLKKAINIARSNIENFHKASIKEEEKMETMEGISCWRKSIGIDKVGLYIPGGTAPLFSTVLMLGIPAILAHCQEIILCSPANKEGKLHPAILYTCHLLGITKIYKLGGAQAIAAMAFGTESIPAVYKIFGPGNQYVTAAKLAVQQLGIAIDMPAGPSEVCVLADESSQASFVAADLLSQAEHGKDSQVLLVSTSESFVQSCLWEVELQLNELPRKEIAEAALKNSKAIIVNSIEEGIDLVNEYAAEHLIICCEDNELIAEKIVNAGSVFLGNYSPESVGDYASGTNHTLPTNGYARAYSGVSVDSFCKKITFQKLTRKGLENIGDTVMEMAAAEGLQAHAAAVEIRLASGK